MIAILSIAFSGLYLSEWKPLRIQGIGGGHDYVDLTSVLNAARCFQEIGKDVYASIDECGYQYGIFLLKFIDLLHLNSLSPFLLGGLLFASVAILLLVTGVLSSVSKKHVFISSLILLAPGPWLLFERGNFDLLIILFLAVTVVTLNSKFSAFGAILLLATALMKFYTFPLLLLYIFLERNKWLRTVIAVVSVGIIPLIIDNIVSSPGYPNPLFVAFGLPIPGLWVNFFAWRFKFDLALGMASQYAIGAFAFLSLLLYFRRSKRLSRYRVMASEIDFDSKLEEKIFLFASLAYVACFLAGSNFDYRLIFLAISLVLFNKIAVGFTQFKLFITIELSALWLTYFYFGATGAVPVLLSITGNAAQLVLAVFLFSYLFNFCLREAKTLLITRFGFHKA